MQGDDGGLGGRRTHLPRRGRYGGDLGRISGFPVQAGHAHHPQHSIPFLYIFPRGVNSPHLVTIGLRTPMSQEHGASDLWAVCTRLAMGDGRVMDPGCLDPDLRPDRTVQRH